MTPPNEQTSKDVYYLTLFEPEQSPSGQGMLSGHGISQDAASPGDAVAPLLSGDVCRRGSVRFMLRCSGDVKAELNSIEFDLLFRR